MRRILGARTPALPSTEDPAASPGTVLVRSTGLTDEQACLDRPVPHRCQLQIGTEARSLLGKRCTSNRWFEIPQDLTRSRLAHGHEPLTGGNQSGDRLIQVS